MPYLVKVGFEIGNINRITSKGFLVKRIGTNVYTEWGAIDVLGLKTKKFAWHLTSQCKMHRFRSTEKAFKFQKHKIAYLIRKRGYNKLPPTSIIYRRKFK